MERGAIVANTGRVIEVFGERIVLRVTGAESGGVFALFEEFTPVGNGPPLHRHLLEEEWFWVVEGRVEFLVEGVRFVRGPGECVHAPRGTAHAFRSLGPGDLRMFIAVSPARIDSFFLEVEKVWKGGPPSEEALAGLFQRFGMELLGPAPW